MSNANAVAKTMEAEYGYDIYNGETYIGKMKFVKTTVRGKVFVYKPRKEGD